MFGKLILESHTGNAIVSVDGWSEDNYIISYICKSLTGYMKNYINKLNGIKKHKRYKECIMCGRLIEDTVSNKKYCPQCAKEIWREYNREKQKEYYNKNKNSV